MKDYFELSNNELIQMIREEIRCKRYDNALIVWGMIKFDSEDEKKYYLAFILVGMGKMDEGVYWAKKITDLSIVKQAEHIILKAYSKAGRIEEFTNYFLNDYSGSVGFIELMNYLYELMYTSKYYTYAENKFFDSLFEQIMMSKKYNEDLKDTNKQDFDRYMLYTLQFMSLFIEALKESEEIYEENNLEGTANAVAKAYGLHNLVSSISPLFTDDFPITDFLDDYKGTVSTFLDATKENILNMDEFDNKWLIYYTILERNSDEKRLINEICEGINRFPKLIANYGYAAIYPLVSTYAKAVICDDDRAMRFEQVLNQSGIADDTISKATVYESVMRQLSVKSQIAYKSACSLYTMAKSNEFEQKDAGPISLAFYRILELESNIVLWEPIIKKVTFEELQRLFNNLNNNDKRKWKVLLSSFEKIENDSGVGLMIGNLRALMRNIKASDELADKLREEYKKLLTEDGVEAFESGKIDEWYSEGNVTKYRNPPAHAKYLHFDIVECCKSYVENEIQNMGKWIKINP